MPTIASNSLARTCQIIFVLIGGVTALYFGRDVLVPVAFALVLAMLLLPLSRKLESWGCHRGLAAAICIVLLVGFFTLIFWLLSWQLSQVMEDGDQLKQKAAEFADKAQEYLSQKLGLPKREQKEMIKGGNSKLMESAGGVFSGLTGILVDLILVLVYIFLLMFQRRHLMNALLKAVPREEQENVRQLTGEAAKVSQKYLQGLALMIVCLWVMYGIGFSIVGVRFAIFFALLCGTLELVPFLGNISGTLATVCMAMLQGGDFSLISGVLIVYGVVQFTQSYILEPLVVGRGVNLNPFFTIFCIVIGEAIWGIAGMVLAVPLFGMLKIVCDHFEPLQPYGFLLGSQEKKKSNRGWFSKKKNGQD